MDEKILNRLSHDGPLQTLSIIELQLDRNPLTIDPQPNLRVRAWVRFGTTPVRVSMLSSVGGQRKPAESNSKPGAERTAVGYGRARWTNTLVETRAR
jgi:hypothetical protein